ncbi:hypothetical protein F4827_006626 [Paraburkholderia bannensis]|uniref:Uncharacterized protein n=1 Tax=Paraburkholderia bannensis TaxID=765414 RepID=A0A7W9U698_9BURK|nr:MULTISPECIES: hypothetical protein [Paraburkholderia]MBB3261750.1 hypothetical protein [Paraburkholderia sp. WP4_3_2]MBB6106750.1 hypothetical protein [Paraburkholderia bannensis]
MNATAIVEFRAHLLVASLIATLLQGLVIGGMLVLEMPEAWFTSSVFRAASICVVVAGVAVVRYVAAVAFWGAHRRGHLSLDAAGHNLIAISDMCPYAQLVLLHVRLNRRRYGVVV